MLHGKAVYVDITMKAAKESEAGSSVVRETPWEVKAAL